MVNGRCSLAFSSLDTQGILSSNVFLVSLLHYSSLAISCRAMGHVGALTPVRNRSSCFQNPHPILSLQSFRFILYDCIHLFFLKSSSSSERLSTTFFSNFPPVALFIYDLRIFPGDVRSSA